MGTRFREHRSISDGFLDDFKTFLEEFSQTDLKYSSFVKIWNEKKCHLIYGGRRTVGELLEFTEEAMNTSAGFILSQKLDVPAAICGLFMIYSMMHTQHSGRKAYVRIPSDKMPSLLAFRQWAQRERDLDTLYVLSSLLRDGVFKFVATQREYGLEKSFRKYVEGPACRGANMFTSLNSTGELRETAALLDPIAAALQEYHKAKCRLPGNNNGEPCRELSYVKLDFVNEITSSLEETMGVVSVLGKKEEIFKNLATRGNKCKKINGRRRKIGQKPPEGYFDDMVSPTKPPKLHRETRTETLKDFVTSESTETMTTFEDSTVDKVSLMNMPIIIEEINESQITDETSPNATANNGCTITMDTLEDSALPVVIDY